MKTFSTIFSVVLLSLTGLFYGCKKSSNSASCNVTGTTVNIGNANGGTYGISFLNPIPGIDDNSDWLSFDNTNLNFFTSGFACYTCNGSNGYIVDAGNQSCLNFSDSVSTSSPQLVAYVEGHGYEGKFPDGQKIKFIAGEYANGIVTITYIFIPN